MSTNIRQADLIESVAAALQYISYYHPADYMPTNVSKARPPKTPLPRF